MISHFFIDRPIFAAVLSIVITLTGAIALLGLPIAQYPEISPPSVQVAISYPGASALVVADTVAAPIEQQVSGVEGMLYMSSQSGNDGSYSLTVTFDVGTDLNTALVMVQNRVTLAIPQLPTQVQRQGITIKKRTPDILLVINFFSPGGRYDDIFLSNYAYINVRDEVFRVEGVSDVNIFGERDYSMRVWLNPQKMAALNVTAGDVAAAIRGQNVEAPIGAVGEPPAGQPRATQLTLNTLGRLRTPEEFGDIVVKVGGVVPATPAQGPSPAPVPTGSGYPGTQQPGSGQPNSLTAAGQVNLTGANGPLLGQSGMSGTTGSTAGSTQRTSSGPMGGPSNLPGIPATSVPAAQSTSTTTGGAGTGAGASSTATAASSGTTSQNSSGGSQSGSGGQTSSGSQGGLSVAGGLVGQNSLTAPSAPAPVPAGATLVGASSRGIQGSQGALAPRLAVAGPRAPAASIVRLRDVARVELGALNYNNACTFDGRPSVGLGVHQLPGTNALDVAERVRAKMRELKKRFPDGVDYVIAYDITPFIRESVDDVVRTLFEAVGLVAVVVLAFLQNWRAALVPLVAVPVAIVGTFAVMAAVGFSLNNISLFGLVLAIGIVVDDAIVVVENVERWLAQGVQPRDAARRAMDEVTGPVVAVAVVLCAVFVPCAFISGITGRFFRQFAVTIAASTAISAFNSLTLSPALAAILLRPHGARNDPLTRVLNLLLGWPFRLFNRAFELGTAAYARAVGWLIRLRYLVLLGYIALAVVSYAVFSRAPTGFIPEQDQGRLIVSIQLPDSASLYRTREALARVEHIVDTTPGVAHTTAVAGMSLVLGANSSNFATMFVILEPFERRRTPELNAFAIMGRLRRECARQVKDAVVNVLGAPAIPGLSVAGGFRIMVEDRANLGPAFLEEQTNRFVAGMRRLPGLSDLITQFRANTPQLYMDVDRVKAESLGVSFGDVDQALEVFLGSLYANSFNLFGRYWQVTAQADGAYRWRLSDVDLIEVRNSRGQMIPLGTLVNLREISGPVMVQRYNEYSAAPVNGNVVPGYSTGQAIAAIDSLAGQTLPRSMDTEWTELMFIEIRAGNTALSVFSVAVLFVFLALAALYESWSLPLAVILVVPLCLLCSVAGVLLTHNAVNIFVQIGLVVLVGLACKNAILIVEFARTEHLAGRPADDAVLEACRLRLRPILMTSFAFILGVVPLVVASGAGAEMRQSLGTAVFSGMLGVTLFGIFLTPVFFVLIERASEARLLRHRALRRVLYVLLGLALGTAFVYLLIDLRVLPARHLPAALLAGAAGGAAVGELVLFGYRGLQSARRGAAPPPGAVTREPPRGDREP